MNYKGIPVRIEAHREGWTLIRTTDGTKPFRSECISPRKIIDVSWSWIPDEVLDDDTCGCVLPEQSCESCRIINVEGIPWR